jgi:hypothetical protein
MLGKVIRVNRATTRGMKFKDPGNLYTGPAAAGNDESWQPIHFIRQGAGDVLFEGSGRCYQPDNHSISADSDISH